MGLRGGAAFAVDLARSPEIHLWRRAEGCRAYTGLKSGFVRQISQGEFRHQFDVERFTHDRRARPVNCPDMVELTVTQSIPNFVGSGVERFATELLGQKHVASTATALTADTVSSA